MEFLIVTKKNSVATITLNRPDMHNAFNEGMMQELNAVFAGLYDDARTRVVVLTGAGKSFCAGADLAYMKSAAQKTHEQNVQESLVLAGMLTRLETLPKPTLCDVNGAALGGGMGLVAACDIAVAHEKAVFGFSEVKLGLAPSVISPFVIRKIGLSFARRYFLTGERFGAAQAKELRLVHEVVNDKNRKAVLDRLTKELLANGPQAMTQVKVLIQKNLGLDDESLKKFTAEQGTRLRSSPEAQGRMKAFLKK